ncbi:MAG: PQQ-binding-like beta-propeller repeat protein [Phycisphaerae bacterium]
MSRDIAAPDTTARRTAGCDAQGSHETTRHAAVRRTTAAMLMVLGGTIHLASAAGPTDHAEKYWPQWRGPSATGVAPHADPPIEWSESNNIRWKVQIPGRGHATPIVWGDRVYVQTAVKTDREAEPNASPEPSDRSGRHRRGGRDWMGSVEPTHIHAFTVLALDRRTGNTVWEKVVAQTLPHEGGHRDASQASNSPVTDGRHVFAHFGSRGLYCLDMQGRLVWNKDLGRMQTRMGFGEGSSPVLHGDTIVVNWDHEGQSFIVALDKRTGDVRWRVDRDEPTSWATPIIVTVNGRAQVVTSATNRIRSYDLATGDIVWESGGMTRNVIPSPVRGDGLVYAMSGFRGSAVRAIRYADAAGDITDSAAVAWTYAGKGTPYVPSPLLYGDTLYFLDNNRAILSCFDAKHGKPYYTKQRLDGLRGIYASPVGARDRVYIVGRNGKTAVIKRGTEFHVLATNTLDDDFSASPAIVDGELYLRGAKYLYCIAEK